MRSQRWPAFDASLTSSRKRAAGCPTSIRSSLASSVGPAPSSSGSASAWQRIISCCAASRLSPPQLKLPLNAGCPPQKRTKGTLPEGKALPIAAAKLAVAGQEAAKQTAPADTCAVFRVKLKGGVKTTLQGWFQDAKGADLCGSFYANVKV